MITALLYNIMNIFGLYLAAVFAGCVWRLGLVWLVSDVWNGLMAYPNLLALWLLARQVRFPRISRRRSRRDSPA